MKQFSDFPLHPEILSALQRMGFEHPTPIQAATMPLVLEGQDVIGLAETGSGKTAACAIPVCSRVDTSRSHIQVLIVVPTRELASQYATEVQKIGGGKGVKAFALFGGENFAVQRAKLKSGVHALVATPGRLIDFIHARHLDISRVDTLILDEADEMFSMGFYDDIEFIIQCLTQPHQTLLFSATMASAVNKLARTHLKQPIEITLTAEQKSPALLSHRFVFCQDPKARLALLCDLIRQLKPHQSLIFGQSRIQVMEVCRALKGKIPGVDYLHGGLSQQIRTTITGKFRSGKLRHLVATDVAARGLDFSGVSHVFHYSLPRDPDGYIHRSGRTGRSGREGVSIALVTRRDLSLVDRILHKVGKAIDWIGQPPGRQPPGSQPSKKKIPRSRHRKRPPRTNRGS